MLILLTIAVFAVCLLALGLGALMKGRCLRGSCGGEPPRIAGITLSCGNCPERDKHTGETIGIDTIDGDQSTK